MNGAPTYNYKYPHYSNEKLMPLSRKAVNLEARKKLQNEFGIDTTHLPEDTNMMKIYSNIYKLSKVLKDYPYTNTHSMINGNTNLQLSKKHSLELGFVITLKAKYIKKPLMYLPHFSPPRTKHISSR